MQFFGFKNTFVQRLLRELVTNISGMPEQNILSSNSLGNETSGAVKPTETAGSKADPNLLPHMAKPQSAAKRNRKARTNNTKSPANSSLKKPRCQNKSFNVKALKSDQQEYGEHPHPFSANKGSPNSSEALQESEASQTIIEREKVLVLVEESFDKDDHLKVDSFSSQGGMKHLNPENNLPLEESMKILKDGKPVSVSTLPFSLSFKANASIHFILHHLFLFFFLLVFLPCFLVNIPHLNNKTKSGLFLHVY